MDIKSIELNDEEFIRMTRYINAGDNEADNRRRAIALGFVKPGVRIAPGAIVRVPPDLVHSNVFIGLYTYVNGRVTLEENVMLGPGCALPAGQHKFDPATGWFSARTDPTVTRALS